MHYKFKCVCLCTVQGMIYAIKYGASYSNSTYLTIKADFQL